MLHALNFQSVLFSYKLLNYLILFYSLIFLTYMPILSLPNYVSPYMFNVLIHVYGHFFARKDLLL